MANINTLQKGLVAHYPLDGVSETKDITPNANHGTNNGATLSTGVKGEANGSYSFDGSNDYIDCGDSTILQPDYVSLSLNFKSTLAGTRIMLRKRTSGYKVSLVDGKLLIQLYSTGVSLNDFTSTGTYNDGLWHNVIVTFSSTQMKIYVDGLLLSTKLVLANKLEYGAGGVAIGRDGNNSFGYFGGSISDVRIYNRALSAEEIKLLYDQYKPKEASVGNLQKGLVLDMPLTTKHMKSSTVVSDRTPYGNDGTVTGATVGSQYTSFDGVDDSIIIPHNANQLLTDGGSFSAWIYPESAGEAGFGRIVDKSTSTAGGQGGYAIYIYETLTIGMRINKYLVLIQTTPNSVPFNNWTYVTAIWNNSGYVKIYVNGVLNVEGQSGSAGGITTTNPLTIGNRSNATDRTFDGDISNIKIYNRALSDDEIKLLYEKGRY
jgi:hypothetical protein